MNACRPKRGTIKNEIRDGIKKRGFYIVPTPDQIPGCRGNRKGVLERIQQFAEDNKWRVTVHEDNGWLLFTADHSAGLAHSPGNHHPAFQKAAKVMEQALRGHRLAPSFGG